MTKCKICKHWLKYLNDIDKTFKKPIEWGRCKAVYHSKLIKAKTDDFYDYAKGYIETKANFACIEGKSKINRESK